MRARTLGLGLLLLALGCPGRGTLFLTIDAADANGSLHIPDDVDRLTVRITNADGSNVLLEKQYDLGPELRFPLTLGLEPGPETGARIRVEVAALKGDQPIGETAAVVPITPQEVTQVTLRIVR